MTILPLLGQWLKKAPKPLGPTKGIPPNPPKLKTPPLFFCANPFDIPPKRVVGVLFISSEQSEAARRVFLRVYPRSTSEARARSATLELERDNGKYCRLDESKSPLEKAALAGSTLGKNAVERAVNGARMRASLADMPYGSSLSVAPSPDSCVGSETSHETSRENLVKLTRFDGEINACVTNGNTVTEKRASLEVCIVGPSHCRKS
mmetsp:Transcript_2528/g.3835  ORF Transcript_2528/g.3835 Transcript_2528/m.3835 type:complete len:206 (+) Transcript_2528:765-1382(+)